MQSKDFEVLLKSIDEARAVRSGTRTPRRVLRWCAILGIAFLLLWAGAFLFARPLLHQQGAWFGLTPHECDLIHYGGLGLLKLLVIVFFLLPYLALRLALRSLGRK